MKSTLRGFVFVVLVLSLMAVGTMLWMHRQERSSEVFEILGKELEYLSRVNGDLVAENNDMSRTMALLQAQLQEARKGCVQRDARQAHMPHSPTHPQPDTGQQQWEARDKVIAEPGMSMQRPDGVVSPGKLPSKVEIPDPYAPGELNREPEIPAELTNNDVDPSSPTTTDATSPSSPSPSSPSPPSSFTDHVGYVSSYVLDKSWSEAPRDTQIWPRPAQMSTKFASSKQAFPFFSFADIETNILESVWDAHVPFIYGRAPDSGRPSSSAAAGGVTRLVMWTQEATDLVAEYPTSEKEEYTLLVEQGTVYITATTAYGVMRGLTTLAQLVQGDHATGFTLSYSWLHVVDKPRFGYRCLLIDPPRVFFKVSQVLVVLDYMAINKMNVLHFRLTDQKGFNVFLPTVPTLVEGHEFYTSEDIAVIVEYAKNRGVRVVPEIDVPGHAQSFKAVGIATQCPDEWTSNLDVTLPRTYEVLERVLLDVAELFPDPYIHVGHDEISKKCWHTNAGVKERAKLLNIKDTSPEGLWKALVHHWVHKFNELVHNHNGLLQKKTFVYWGDIVRYMGSDLHSFPHEGVVFQPWMGFGRAPVTAAKGYRTIISNLWWTYIDRLYPDDKRFPATEFIKNWIQTYTRDIFFENPVKVDGRQLQPHRVEPEVAKYYIGLEISVWENGFSQYEHKVWPGITAFSELLWSQEYAPFLHDWDDLTQDFERKLKFDAWSKSRAFYDNLAEDAKVAPSTGYPFTEAQLLKAFEGMVNANRNKPMQDGQPIWSVLLEKDLKGMYNSWTNYKASANTETPLLEGVR